MYSPLHDTLQSREWLFAVCLTFKYRLSFVGSFSPSGRDKEGKGIHYSCWLKSDFGPKAVHGWIVFGTHRLSTCFANGVLCNHRCWLIGCNFPSSLFSSLRASRSLLFSVLADDLTTDGPLQFSEQEDDGRAMSLPWISRERAVAVAAFLEKAK